MAPLLEIDQVSKHFGANRALDRVSFSLEAGEVQALVGENGAGKSTLVHILFGVVQPDRGTIRIAGAPTVIAGPREAQRLGIGIVFQELSLVGSLSVAENIYAGRAPARGSLIDWAALNARARTLLEPLGLTIDPAAKVDSLRSGARQIVEIAKALSLEARILLLDEPTSALGPDEVVRLLALLRKLKARGIGIVYVSHRMPEIFSIGDRITVLRNGRRVATHAARETDAETVVREMVGREIAGAAARSGGPATVPRLRARGLARAGVFADVDLALHGGEIVGLTGLMGAGRSELARTLAGILEPTSGRIELDDRPVRLRGIAQAISAKIAYLPAERHTEGLFAEASIADNVVAATLKAFARFGLLDRRRRDETSADTLRQLRVKAASVGQPVASLSGGNQQKVLLARWLLTSPRVLIVEEPTRGIDIGAKLEIYDLLGRLADSGTAILVVSSDPPEIIALCDRTLVMHAGRIAGELPRETASEERIMRLAAGLRNAA